MSNSSALIGTTPNTPNDALIRKGLIAVAPSNLNPVPGEPFGPPRPANYVYSSWSTSLLIGLGFAIFIVSFITISRLAVRRFYVRDMGMDDLVIVFGALGCLTYLTSVTIQASAGCLGEHIWDCTYAQINVYYLWGRANFSLFAFTVFTVKLSIALQNRRMTLMVFPVWRVIHWSFIILFSILIPLLTFLTLFECEPFGAGYSLIDVGRLPDPAQQYRCPINVSTLSIATRIVHAVTDIALLSVPIVLVCQLRMPWSKKGRLVAIFAVGGMSTVASIVRIVRISGDAVDDTYASRIVYVFDLIDICTATVVASMPALNAIVDPTVEKIKAWAHRRTGREGNLVTTTRSQSENYFSVGVPARK